MLVPYNNDYEKITMGLLSYVPDLDEPSRIEEELNWYNAQDNRKIYLWKSEETSNLIGFVGVEEEEDLVLLRHIAIDPSFRNEGLAYRMLDALQEKYDSKNIVATLITATIISKWQKRVSENKDTLEDSKD
ncbi:MAG TPA: GNAT family N-acetyltransferase [Atopostipes sp.]|nr:GNAT family N-acetyltransferase [Atopostipes sp.]